MRPFFSILLVPVVLGLNACDGEAKGAETKAVETPVAATPAPVEAPVEKAPATAAPSPAPASEPVAATEENPAMVDPQFPTPVDIGGFGSDEPAERADMPSRGVIVLGPESWTHSNGAHWETYMGKPFKAKRWGRYQVRLNYTLNRSALGMQFRMGDLIVKKQLPSSPSPRKTHLGELYIAQSGEMMFSLLTPPTENAGFVIHDITLIPAPEGETIKQAEDGSITLNAKDATTWSENMRYEPKPEKNCLGFWTSEDDLAEWEFEVTKPGRYKVMVSHGCGGGNHGSEVEVKHAGQSLKFTTQDTGGFQNWQEIPVGEIEIQNPGRQRLQIDPVNKVKSAVLDVQKVVLVPLG